jgi:hypothetical protein
LLEDAEEFLINGFGFKLKQGGFANGVAISDSSAIRVKFVKI